jgi:hypothetical protein
MALFTILIKVWNTDLPHWVKRLYKHDEDIIPLACAVWGFSTLNAEP